MYVYHIQLKLEVITLLIILCVLKVVDRLTNIFSFIMEYIDRIIHIYNLLYLLILNMDYNIVLVVANLINVLSLCFKMLHLVRHLLKITKVVPFER